MTDRKIILASGSPRRRELLAGLDVQFTVDTGNTFEEVVVPGTPAHDVPVAFSVGKSHGFHRPLAADEILITADTVVICSEEPAPEPTVLGKPHNRQEAVEMLRALSGRTHEVLTSVTIRTTESEETFTDSTLVKFAQMGEEEINYYIDRYKPYDKAGGYGIQEWIGYACIEGIQGSYFNVMGFPVHKVWEALKKY